jgi:hypothetical protein
MQSIDTQNGLSFDDSIFKKGCVTDSSEKYQGDELIAKNDQADC